MTYTADAVEVVTARLLGTLGPALTSTLGGATNVHTATAWTQRGANVLPEVEARLRLADRALTAITAAEDADVARGWFIAANPLLGGDSPVEAIREDRQREVEGAVAAVVAGTWVG